jgi:hydroxymethylpyrimidine/phosphomethylpyrimidine kinase
MSSPQNPPPRLLSIAGSDSGGGAGIQADLKAFARCGAHGMTAITAITAQSTTGVTAVYPLPPEAIVEQVRAVAEDIGVDAVKIGMLGTAEAIDAVARALDMLPDAPVVLDPVMVAESGARLLDEDAEEALRTRLVPRMTVVTPNLAEAAVLAHADAGAGPGPGPEPGAETLARAIHALGPRAVVVTGGHRDEATDLFFDGDRLVEIPGERYPDGASHGSGCTHSSVLAANLALGVDPLEAARRAKRIASEAVRDGLRGLGSGAGPVDVLGLSRRPRPAAAGASPAGGRGRLGAVATEWRVEVELHDEGHGYGLGERLRALRLDDEARERLGRRVIVTRDGSRVFLYADSEETTREAERVVRELVAEHELTADIRITRWDPVEEAWKDASEPLPASEEERQAALARKEAAEAEEAREQGRYNWEVHADLESHKDAVRLAERLEDEGHAVTRRWSYLLVGALTEERARELAEWLRAEAPAGTKVETVPVLDEPAHPAFVWLGAHGLAPPG